MPPREQETMTKATTRPYRARQLVNQHHDNRTATTGTVAPCHAMSWRGEQDHDDHDDGHAWTRDDAKTRHGGLPAKFTHFSLPRALDHLGRENASLYV